MSALSKPHAHLYHTLPRFLLYGHLLLFLDSEGLFKLVRHCFLIIHLVSLLLVLGNSTTYRRHLVSNCGLLLLLVQALIFGSGLLNVVAIAHVSSTGVLHPTYAYGLHFLMIVILTLISWFIGCILRCQCSQLRFLAPCRQKSADKNSLSSY